MIPALARWNGDHAMTKDTTKEAAWPPKLCFWMIGSTRSRTGFGLGRGFIETMLEEELSEALSRPRYGRRKPGEDEAAPSVVGVRHGHRERTLMGTFGKTRIAAPCARLTGEGRGRQDARMAERFAARPPAPHPSRRRLDRRGLSREDQHRRVRRALNAVFAEPVGKDVVSASGARRRATGTPGMRVRSPKSRSRD